MRKKLTLKERLEAISSTIHAAADRSAANAVQKACNEALAAIERLENDAFIARHKVYQSDDEIARLRAERDEAVGLISALNVWFRKTQSNDEGGHAGANYLNGDSDIHPGNGWEDIERIAEKGADFLAKHKEAGADDT